LNATIPRHLVFPSCTRPPGRVAPQVPAVSSGAPVSRCLPVGRRRRARTALGPSALGSAPCTGSMQRVDRPKAWRAEANHSQGRPPWWGPRRQPPPWSRPDRGEAPVPTQRSALRRGAADAPPRRPAAPRKATVAAGRHERPLSSAWAALRHPSTGQRWGRRGPLRPSAPLSTRHPARRGPTAAGPRAALPASSLHAPGLRAEWHRKSPQTPLATSFRSTSEELIP